MKLERRDLAFVFELGAALLDPARFIRRGCCPTCQRPYTVEPKEEFVDVARENYRLR